MLTAEKTAGVMKGGDIMGKLLWSKPYITEIQVKMTEDDKVGSRTDQYSTATNNLTGDIKPEDSCCCS